jgi:hypothetical protein
VNNLRDLSGEPYKSHREHQRRKARLEAAAPELLEALKVALRDSGCDGDLCMYQWHEQARAAIAKVEDE